MKCVSTVLHTVLLVAGVAAAKSPYGAYLWTIDHGSTHQAGAQVQSITSDVAENILVSRQGLPETAYRHPVDDESLTDITKYGGYQRPLFSTGREQTPERLQISITGYTGCKQHLEKITCTESNSIVAVSEFNTLPDLWVEGPSKSLQDTFESKLNIEDTCEYHIVPSQRKDISIKYTYPSLVSASGDRTFR